MATHSFGAGYHLTGQPRKKPVYADHRCRYCGLAGKAGKGRPLLREGADLYACRDVDGCGARIRQRQA